MSSCRSPQAPPVKAARAEDALSRREVAELTNSVIHEMTRDELIRVILASRHPWRGPELDSHLRFIDRESLLCMAFLARKCCCNQLSARSDASYGANKPAQAVEIVNPRTGHGQIR
jgi:hypothetical protein